MFTKEFKNRDNKGNHNSAVKNMADFCRECSIEMFDCDTGDFKGLAKEGEYVHVLCEGCAGTIVVDHNGQRVPSRAELIDAATRVHENHEFRRNSELKKKGASK